MRKPPANARKFIVILTVIATLLLVFAMVDFRMFEAAKKDIHRGVLVFFILAVLVEVLGVELRGFGYISPGLCVYTGVMLVFDYSLAMILTAVSLAFRVFFVSRQNFFHRMADFSTNIIKVAVAGIAFTLIADNQSMFSVMHIAGGIVAIILFYGMDFLLDWTLTNLVREGTREEHRKSRHPVLFYFIFMAPLGFIIAILYNINPFLSLLALFPLYLSRQAIFHRIRDIEIGEHNQLKENMANIQKDKIQFEKRSEALTQDLNRKVEEMSVLNEMGQSLGTSVDMESTLEVIVSKLKKVINYQSCVIFLIEFEGESDKKGTLVVAKSVTPYRELLEYSNLLKLQENFINLVIQHKKSIIREDVQAGVDERIFKDEKSIMVVPLIVKNTSIGAIYVGTFQSGAYKQEHLNMLTLLSNTAANAIKTSQLYEQQKKDLIAIQQLNSQLDSNIRQLKALLELGRALGSSLNLENTLKIIIDQLEYMFNYQSGAVFLVREAKTGDALVPLKFRTPYEEIFKTFSFAMKDPTNIMGWIAMNQKPLRLADARLSKVRNILEYERSVMVVPLIAENIIIGTLYLGHSQPDYFNDDALNLLSTVAYQSAMAIKNAELYEKTATMAITDGLTGLFTHRYFQERMDEEIKIATRNGKNIGLVMVDTDHFKQYNDTLGHPEGDILLKEIASLLKSYTRDSDVVCRYGGDEFTLILKEVSKKNAIQKAETIRQAFQSRFYSKAVRITASIGVACFPEDADNKKDLMRKCDDALYRSKKGGRNRVSWAKAKTEGEDLTALKSAEEAPR